MGTYFLEPPTYQALVLAASHLEYTSVAQKHDTIGIESAKLAKKINKFIATFERPPLKKNTISEYRVGRNFIRVGDAVKITPSAPRKRDGFVAEVKEIEIDEQGNPKAIHVIGGKNGAFRAIRPERIKRVAQSKIEKRP
jgi:hypothetical protein